MLTMESGAKWVLLALVAMTVGCGESTGGKLAVTGKVTFQGKPLPQGTIEFSAEDASSMSGSVITNGEYSITAVQGLLPGKYVVRLHAADEKSTASATEAPGTESLQPAAKELIPADFNVNSKLIYEVRAGQKNEYNVDIP